MSKEGREAHIFRDAGKRCPVVNPPEPGISIPSAVMDMLEKYPICFEKEGKVKVGDMSVRCECVVSGDGEHIAHPSIFIVPGLQ